MPVEDVISGRRQRNMMHRVSDMVRMLALVACRVRPIQSEALANVFPVHVHQRLRCVFPGSHPSYSGNTTALS